MDPVDPYRYVSIRGEVVEVTEDGAIEHATVLARRYMNVEQYPNLCEEQGPRVTLLIRPDRVVPRGDPAGGRVDGWRGGRADG